jgi:CheY-like chemotaxis protein
MEPRLKYKILIVEDSKIIRLANSALFKSYGLQPDIAVDGIDAINKCMHNEYNLILLDIGLPFIDGIKVCKVIKEHSKRGIPSIIAITAHKQSVEQECKKAGIDEIIDKPLTTIKIKKLLAKWLTK